MGGSVDGGRKAAQTNKALYGDDWYSKIGKIGGRKGGKGKGFAVMSKEQHRAASSKGGQLGSPTGWSREKYLDRVKQYAQRHNEKGIA